MNAPLLVASGILLILLAVAAYRISRLRILLRSMQAGAGTLDCPIPTIELEELDPLFRRDELGFTRDCEIQFIGGVVMGGTTDTESWILAALARRAGRMFEFGTATGRTTYLWARNSAADARLVTMTLGPDQLGDYTAAAADSKALSDIALSESCCSRFYYSETPVEYKVTQLFGDSKRLDDTPFAKQFDLIFIDGSHAYSYVKSDTEKALSMLKDGGLLLWHDYRPCWKDTADVYRYLNELKSVLPLRRIQGTALVCYRAPAAAAPTRQ
jgi:hypothetical protein